MIKMVTVSDFIVGFLLGSVNRYLYGKLGEHLSKKEDDKWKHTITKPIKVW